MNRDQKIKFLSDIKNGARKLKRVLDIEACSLEEKKRAEKILSQGTVSTVDEKWYNALPHKFEWT